MRYLDVFDSVTVLARVAETETLAGQGVEGKHVGVQPVPNFHGPYGLVRHRTAVQLIRGSAVCGGAPRAYVARVPGIVGGLMTSS